MTVQEKIATYVMSGGEIARLSSRQRQIVKLRTEGHPLKAIAADLGISAKTVEGHWTSATKVLGLFDVALVTQWALKYGLASWVV